MNRIMIIYIISSIFLFLILGIVFINRFEEFYDVYLINFGYLIVFSFIILLLLKHDGIRVRHLLFFSFIVPLFTGMIYVFSIYEHSGFLFQYVPSDAPFYDESGREIAKGNLIEGINKLVKITKYGYDDMGMIFYVGSIYKIIDSPLAVKVVNLFVNLINTLLIYKTALFIMNKRYSIFAALCFSIASFNIYFLIVGLKEPIMMTFILIYFYSFTIYLKKRHPGHLILLLACCISLSFFRIEIMIFLLLSSLTGLMFINGITSRKLILFSIVIGFILINIYAYGEYLELISFQIKNPTVYSGDYETSSKISLPIVAIAGIFGPLPTLIPHTVKSYADVSVYGASLILKLTISFYAIYGIIFILREKKNEIIPIITFIIIEILALILIENTFKVRYAMPHMPFLFILGFYGIYQVFEKEIPGKKLMIEIATGFQIGSIVLILLWNFLRL